MTNYKLTYFNARARGEIIRLVFAAADVKFTDNRLSFAEWPSVKPSAPFGKVPFLEVDGKALGESRAISLFLASQFGFSGKTKWEQALVESVVDTVVDVRDAALPIFFIKDKQAQESKRKEFLEKTLTPTLAKLDAFLNKNNGGTGWFVGSDMTVADLFFYDLCDIVVEMVPDLLKEFPKLQAFNERVEKVPKLAEYIAKRPRENQKLVL